LNATERTLRLGGDVTIAGGSARFEIVARFDDTPPVPVIDGDDIAECGIATSLSAARSFDVDGHPIVRFEWFKDFGLPTETRASTRVVEAQPNAPQLIRVVRHPFQLQGVRPVRASMERARPWHVRVGSSDRGLDAVLARARSVTT
jgi:hypothetical protein